MGNGLLPGSVNGPGSYDDIDEGTSALTGTPPPGTIGLDAKSGSSKPSGPSMADRIVAFARRRRGEVFGDGECFTLADRALRAAGAKSAADFGEVTHDGDYIWGTAVGRTDLQPGDIIQLRNYRCEIESTTEHADGSDDIVTQTEERPHHTAIVESIGANGIVTVLEQNYPEGAPVTRNRLHLTTTTYSSGSTTTRAEVGGTFWFYRPQAR
jgi:hypothetical protein